MQGICERLGKVHYLFKAPKSIREARSWWQGSGEGEKIFELVEKMARPYMIGTDRYQNNYLLFKGAPERIFVNRSYKEGSDDGSEIIGFYQGKADIDALIDSLRSSKVKEELELLRTLLRIYKPLASCKPCPLITDQIAQAGPSSTFRLPQASELLDEELHLEYGYARKLCSCASRINGMLYNLKLAALFIESAVTCSRNIISEKRWKSRDAWRAFVVSSTNWLDVRQAIFLFEKALEGSSGVRGDFREKYGSSDQVMLANSKTALMARIVALDASMIYSAKIQRVRIVEGPDEDVNVGNIETLKEEECASEITTTRRSSRQKKKRARSPSPDPIYQCEVCAGEDLQEVMLTCDKCVRSYHGHCLRPAIEYQEKWLCSECRTAIDRSSRSRRRRSRDRRNARLICSECYGIESSSENLLTCFVSDCNTSYHPTCLEPAVRMNVYEGRRFFCPSCKETGIADAYTESLKASEEIERKLRREKRQKKKKKKKKRKKTTSADMDKECVSSLTLVESLHVAKIAIGNDWTKLRKVNVRVKYSL